MKVTHLLFPILILTITCAALMSGTSYASPSQQTSAESSPTTASNRSHDGHPHDAKRTAQGDDGKRQEEESPSDEQQALRHASDQNHLRSLANLTSANRPKLIPNSREHSTSGNAMKRHQPGLTKSGGVANGGLVKNEKIIDARPVQTSSVARSAAPSLNNLRHRGANPAVVGGSAISESRNTGAINGTRMNRKP
jgi:hypothetical protein